MYGHGVAYVSGIIGPNICFFAESLINSFGKTSVTIVGISLAVVSLTKYFFSKTLVGLQVIVMKSLAFALSGKLPWNLDKAVANTL